MLMAVHSESCASIMTDKNVCRLQRNISCKAGNCKGSYIVLSGLCEDLLKTIFCRDKSNAGMFWLDVDHKLLQPYSESEVVKRKIMVTIQVAARAALVLSCSLLN